MNLRPRAVLQLEAGLLAARHCGAWLAGSYSLNKSTVWWNLLATPWENRKAASAIESLN